MARYDGAQHRPVHRECASMDRVHEVVAAHRVAVRGPQSRTLVGWFVAPAGGSAEHAPASAGRDLAQLLDVDVHEVATVGGFHPTHDAPGGAVEPPQLGNAAAAQHVCTAETFSWSR